MHKNLVFVTLMFAGLTLVPGLAHVFQMQQKMGLGPDSYRIGLSFERGGNIRMRARRCPS